MKTTFWMFFFIVCVAIANIALNFTVKQAAQKAEFEYVRAILSYPFFVAFLVGTASLLLLLRVYSLGVPSGIALMGAISIVGGSLWARFALNYRLDTVEW